MSRTYTNALDSGRDIGDDEKVQAYAYGKERIPFNTFDKDTLKYKSDKCLKAIIFIKQSNVPRTPTPFACVCLSSSSFSTHYHFRCCSIVAMRPVI